MKTLSVKVPDALNEQLTALARRKGKNRSTLVRQAISDYVPRSERPIRGSFLDLAKDLAGCLSAGFDLASRSKSLRGYGR